MKYMSVEEFLRLGFLQELNRQFLHPAGLAISVSIDDDGTVKLGDIWDCREDPEGLFFADGVISKEKGAEYARLHDSKFMVRQAKFGWSVQPLDN